MRPSSLLGVDAVALRDREEVGRAAVGIDQLDLEPRGLGAVALEEVLDGERERLAARQEHDDLHRLGELVERGQRGLACD